jgi:hypothetical protein
MCFLRGRSHTLATLIVHRSVARLVTPPNPSLATPTATSVSDFTMAPPELFAANGSAPGTSNAGGVDAGGVDAAGVGEAGTVNVGTVGDAGIGGEWCYPFTGYTRSGGAGC